MNRKNEKLIAEIRAILALATPRKAKRKPARVVPYLRLVVDNAKGSK